MSNTAIPVLNPPWALVKHELEMQRQTQPQPLPQFLPQSAQEALGVPGVPGVPAFPGETSFSDIMAQLDRQAAARAADYLLGKRPTLSDAGSRQSQTTVTSLTSLNGGPTAWGGALAGLPRPIQQLPRVAEPSAQPQGGLPNSTYFDKGRQITAWWDKTKWVAKTATRALGYVQLAMKVHDIYQWARSYQPSVPKLPDRVETQYVIGSASLLYKHPGGYWRVHPPPGYGADGAKMW